MERLTGQEATKVLFDLTTMHDWQQVRRFVQPVWAKALGQHDLSFDFVIKDFSEKTTPGIGMAEAFPEQGAGAVYFSPDEHDHFYTAVLHELVHLWAFQRGGVLDTEEMDNLSFKDVFKPWQRNEENEAAQFLSFLHPSIYQNIVDVVKTTDALYEGATGIMELFLIKEFAGYYGLDRNKFLGENIRIIFATDDLSRTPPSVALLVLNGYDLDKAAQYVLHTPIEKIVADITLVLQTIKTRKGLETVTDQLKQAIQEKYGFEISIGKVDDSNFQAIGRMAQTSRNLEEKRKRVSQYLPIILESGLFKAYLNRQDDPNTFMAEAEKAMGKSKLNDLIAHLISQAYNYVLTRSKEPEEAYMETFLPGPKEPTLDPAQVRGKLNFALTLHKLNPSTRTQHMIKVIERFLASLPNS